MVKKQNNPKLIGSLEDRNGFINIPFFLLKVTKKIMRGKNNQKNLFSGFAKMKNYRSIFIIY